MSLPPPAKAIIAETRGRFWYLPDIMRERKRQARNAYMRGYMRAYRKTALSPLSVSLSRELRRRLDAAAHTAGYPPTTFLRKAAFAYIDRNIVLPASFEQALFNATSEIRRLGNNLNQLAHHANLRQSATLRELQQARQLLTALEAAVTRFIPPLPAGDDR
jgi:hypothetical protein